MKVKPDPCQKQACAIQKCLQANNYKESSCTIFFNDMVQCCLKYRDLSGCCSGFKKEIAEALKSQEENQKG